MSEQKLNVETRTAWRTYCRDNEGVDPIFQVMNHGDLKQARKEYREKRKLSKLAVIKQTRVPCNVEGCYDFAEVILELEIPGISPEFQGQDADVTCLCKKHHDRLARDFSERILTLEDRVDELSKELENMYDLFEHKNTD